MELQIHFRMNSHLYLHDPQETATGKKILKESILLIHKIGLEEFTFLKLAKKAGITEATVYRYFENKHRLLSYLVAWYWTWLHWRIARDTGMLAEPEEKLRRIIRMLASPVRDDLSISFVNERILHEIVAEQGAKAYLTKHVGKDNRMNFFKPYKELCYFIGHIILECRPGYAYPHSLSSTLIEAAYMQKFYHNHLPSLTDFSEGSGTKERILFLDNLVFSVLAAHQK